MPLTCSSARAAQRAGVSSRRTPLVYLFAAVVVGAVYGALWLSVRHQDPYVGPSLAVIGWVYGIVAVSIVVSATAYRRATRGVRGPSRREDAIRGLAIGVPWIAVYVFDGALKANGFEQRHRVRRVRRRRALARRRHGVRRTLRRS